MTLSMHYFDDPSLSIKGLSLSIVRSFTVSGQKLQIHIICNVSSGSVTGNHTFIEYQPKSEMSIYQLIIFVAKISLLSHNSGNCTDVIFC